MMPKGMMPKGDDAEHDAQGHDAGRMGLDAGHEHDLIARYLAPLAAASPEALGLRDDAARLFFARDQEVVVSTDSLVEGVHFLADTPPSLIARKLLRVNLSDLAAMGAGAGYHLVNLSLPPRCDEAWWRDFALGLAQDQEAFSSRLIGGDSTRTEGPIVASITVLGRVEVPAAHGGAWRRSRALAGDILAVSGSIGDGFLGLLLARGDLEASVRGVLRPEDEAFFHARYHLPRPRLDLVRGLAGSGWVRAATDISDGLLMDCAHLARVSGVAAVIEADKVPFSPAAQRLIAAQPDLRTGCLRGGDDYELLLALPPAVVAQTLDMARTCGTALTVIGHLHPGMGITVCGLDEELTPSSPLGWSHFSSK